MGFSLPSFKYPPARPDEGYWNPITSTINWCEGIAILILSLLELSGLIEAAEDYYATIYSAEIVNTLTNLLFIYLGVKGIRNCLKYGHDSIFVVSFCGCKDSVHQVLGITDFCRSACWKWFLCLSQHVEMYVPNLYGYSVTNPTCRPNAAGGWALNDLHGNYYVLRYFLVCTIPTCPSGTGCWVGFIGSLHYSLRPLSTGYEKNTDIVTSSTTITSKTPTSTRMPLRFS